MLAFLRERGFDPAAEPAGSRGVRPLPFALVFGRSHVTVSYDGANIYPENVTVALEQAPISDRLNSEFAHYVPAGRRLPRVAFAPAGDPDWFPAGVKHRYTRRPVI